MDRIKIHCVNLWKFETIKILSRKLKICIHFKNTADSVYNISKRYDSNFPKYGLDLDWAIVWLSHSNVVKHKNEMVLTS